VRQDYDKYYKTVVTNLIGNLILTKKAIPVVWQTVSLMSPPTWSGGREWRYERFSPRTGLWYSVPSSLSLLSFRSKNRNRLRTYP